MQTEDEILQTITRIAKHLAPKYTFDCYDTDDIIQEAILMGLEAMPRYDSGRPLENFLYTHINNRLKNLKRDKYFRPGPSEHIQQRKKNILDAGALTDGGVLHDNEPDLDFILDTRELINKIEGALPAKYRADFLRLRSGAKLQPKRKQELLSIIKGILDVTE